MDPVRFAGMIRYWKPEQASGLAVVDIPAELIPAFGGLKQQRVHGRIGSGEFVSNVMPVGAGRLALSVSKAMMTTAGLGVGNEAAFVITRVGRD